MKRRLCLGLSLLLLPAFLSADVGLTAGQTLQRTVAARPSALGEAYTAVEGDLDGATFNPAGLARLSLATISSTYRRDLSETTFGSVNFGQKFSFGGWFVGGSFFDAGTIDVNQSNGVRSNRNAQQDFVGTLGLAIGRDKPLSFGVGGKLLRSTLAEEATATTIAADVGTQWHTPIFGLAVGLAAQNLGPGVKYENETDPLPQTVRAGVSYLLDLQESKTKRYFPYTFLFLIDGVKVKGDDAGVHAGLELSRRFSLMETDGRASLRGGYRSEAEMGDMGVGFIVGQTFFDYSLHLLSDLDPSHRMTLGYRFAPKEKEKRLRLK